MNLPGRKDIETLVPDYFAKFDADRPVHDEWELEAIDQPDWLEGMVELLAEHELLHPEQRAHLSEADQVRLCGLEVCMREALLEATETSRIGAGIFR